jgi:LPS export ABC transporter protein LptC
MKGILVLLLALLLSLIVTLMYLYQERDESVRLAFVGKSYMEDVSISQKKDGAVKWTLHANEAVFLNKTDVALSDVKIAFPEKELTLTSSEGNYDIETRDLTLKGAIKAATSDYDILADSLYWDAAKNELLSDKKVTIVGKSFVVEGENMTATTDRATLRKGVKATFYDK